MPSQQQAVLAHLEDAVVMEGLRTRPLKASLRSSAVHAMSVGKTYPMGQWIGASKERSFWVCSACQAVDPEAIPSQMKRFQHLGASIRRYLTHRKPVLCPWLHLGENVNMLVVPSQPPTHRSGGLSPMDTLLPSTLGPKRSRFSRGDASTINLLAGMPATHTLAVAGLTPSNLPLFPTASTTVGGSSIPMTAMVPTTSTLQSRTAQDYARDVVQLQLQLTEIRAKKAGFRSLVEKMEAQESQLLAQMSVYSQQLKAELEAQPKSE